jgi:hypothetical protein
VLGIIDDLTRDHLFKIAQSFYFPERSYNKIVQASFGIVPQDQLESFKKFITEDKRDLKMEDAVELLYRVREIADES